MTTPSFAKAIARYCRGSRSSPSSLEAADGTQAYRLYKESAPDLVIMDLTMPGLGGIEAIKRIRQWDHGARILVFTMHQNAAYAIQAIRAGAKGYVTKSSPRCPAHGGLRYFERPHCAER